MIQVLFVHALKPLAHIKILPIMQLLTKLHVRSDISYIEGFDGSDIDDLKGNAAYF